MKNNHHLTSKTALLLLVGLFYSAVEAQVPQLGRDDVKRVISAMTLQEKARLVVGMGFKFPGVPPSVYQRKLSSREHINHNQNKQQMEKVIVRYKLKAGMAEENEELVRGVYEQLHREGMIGFSYSTYKFDDGLTFLHIANYFGEGKAPLPGIEAFKKFSAKIKDRCDELPVVSHVTEIGSYDFRHD